MKLINFISKEEIGQLDKKQFKRLNLLADRHCELISKNRNIEADRIMMMINWILEEKRRRD